MLGARANRQLELKGRNVAEYVRQQLLENGLEHLALQLDEYFWPSMLILYEWLPKSEYEKHAEGSRNYSEWVELFGASGLSMGTDRALRSEWPGPTSDSTARRRRHASAQSHVFNMATPLPIRVGCVARGVRAQAGESGLTK